MTLSRQETIQQLKSQTEVSVVIVGGGINGAALLRELAINKVDAVLIDKGDFASGASAACSRMVHGGLRYLENGDFDLVNEALLERNRLLKNAPHVVRPILTNIPVYSWLSGITNSLFKFLKISDKPSQRGAFIIKVGLMFYDFFTRKQRYMPRHAFNSKKLALQKYPQLNKNIVCTAQYYDAFVDQPERIALELIQDALAESSSCQAINYMRLDAIEGSQLVLVDQLSQEKIKVKPQVVVNATGAWVDHTNQKLQANTNFVGGTKGSHIIIDHPALKKALGDEMFLYENEGGRVCIVIPYGDYVMIGSTDIRVDEPDEAQCEQAEIDYMFESANQVFPDVDFKSAKIISRFCGVRPLPSSDAAFTGSITRDHACKLTPADDQRRFPIFSMYGGKWTTFRSFAELATTEVLTALDQPVTQTSAELAIGGGCDYPVSDEQKRAFVQQLIDRFALSRERAQVLFMRYGTKAIPVAEYLTAEPDQPLPDTDLFSYREIKYMIEHEYVVSLDDLVLRRTLLALHGYLTPALFDALASILAESLAWDQAYADKLTQHTRSLLKSRYSVQF